MKFERACYSRAAVMECVTAVKKTAWTVDKRVNHQPKSMEVKKLFELCREKTGCCLFDYEYSPCEDYLKAAFRKDTPKKELDRHLHRCHMFLADELRGILGMMQSGEVDEVA